MTFTGIGGLGRPARLIFPDSRRDGCFGTIRFSRNRSIGPDWMRRFPVRGFQPTLNKRLIHFGAALAKGRIPVFRFVQSAGDSEGNDRHVTYGHLEPIPVSGDWLIAVRAVAVRYHKVVGHRTVIVAQKEERAAPAITSDGHGTVPIPVTYYR